MRAIPISKELHLNLKLLSLAENKRIYQIVAEAIDSFLKKPTKMDATTIYTITRKSILVSEEQHKKIKTYAIHNNTTITNVLLTSLINYTKKYGKSN
jgi:hypothetical protein